MQHVLKETSIEHFVCIDRRAGNRSCHLGRLAIGDSVLGVIQTQLHGDRAFIIDEPADAYVVLWPEQIPGEKPAHVRLVVAPDAVNGEVVALRWLRNVDIRGSVELFAGTERKVPFAVAEKPQERTAASIDGRPQEHVAAFFDGSLRWLQRQLGLRRPARSEYGENYCLNQPPLAHR